jgi:hypothetical protein
MRKTPISLPDYRDVQFSDMPLVDPYTAYSAGFIGCAYNGEEDERLQSIVESEGQLWRMGDIAHASGFAGQGAGKVILPFKEIEKVGWLDRLGYPNQECGDCVSHATAKAMGTTLCCSIGNGIGSIPETNGLEHKLWPIASEPHYWYRGRSSDGWYASASLRIVKEKTGLVIRKNIPGAIDLTNYSRATAHRYGAVAPPETVRDHLDDNPVITFSICETYEEIIDALSSGFGIQTDGGEGFARTVDNNGVAKRSGSWAHSMSIIGFVDTAEFKNKYGCGGLIFQNSWGAWNNNSNGVIMGTSVKLPNGAFVALWNDISKRSYFAVSDVKGWPNRPLPSWNLRILI